MRHFNSFFDIVETFLPSMRRSNFDRAQDVCAWTCPARAYSTGTGEPDLDGGKVTGMVIWYHVMTRIGLYHTQSEREKLRSRIAGFVIACSCSIIAESENREVALNPSHIGGEE